MKIYNFSESHAQFGEEIINVSDSNPIPLIHDIFYNKTGKFVEIYTVTGKAGTQLTETTDYTIGGAYTGDYPTGDGTLGGDTGYTTIAITNVTYHNVDLYVYYYPISDSSVAEKWNNDIPCYDIFHTGSDFVFQKKRAHRYNWMRLNITRDATDRTVTLPDPTDDFWRGVHISVNVIGSGAGNIEDESVNADDINGPGKAWTTVGPIIHHGVGQIDYLCNGTDWEVLPGGAWDVGIAADVTYITNQRFKKYTDGTVSVMASFNYNDRSDTDVVNNFFGSSSGTLYRAQSTWTFPIAIDATKAIPYLGHYVGNQLTGILSMTNTDVIVRIFDDTSTIVQGDAIGLRIDSEWI